MSNVPKLRFKEFSGEWKKSLLGKYGNLINGLTYSPNDIVENGLLVLRSSNIQNNQMSYDDNVYVNLPVKDESLTKENDILICVRNGSKRLIGKNVLIPSNIPNATHGAFMTVFRGESNKFIFQWLNSSMFFKQVHMNLGATINSINGSDLKKFKVIFPNKQEQEKIASFLTSVDTKIEQLTKKEELLQQYKKGVMQKIFNQEIRFKADDGSEFCDWEEKKLGEICNKISSGKSKQVDNGRYELYGSTGVIGTTEEASNIGRYILVARVGANAGLANLVDGEFGVTDNTLVVDLKQSVDIVFVLMLLKHYNLNRLVFGSGQPLITGGELKALKMKFPCLEEQTKIANFLSSIDSKIEQVQKQLAYTKEFKKALLQQMFV